MGRGECFFCISLVTLHYVLRQAFALKIVFIKYASYSTCKVQAEYVTCGTNAILLMGLLTVSSKTAFRNMMTIKRNLRGIKSISNNSHLSYMTVKKCARHN